jgi:hypothetical protein
MPGGGSMKALHQVIPRTMSACVFRKIALGVATSVSDLQRMVAAARNHSGAQNGIRPRGKGCMNFRLQERASVLQSAVMRQIGELRRSWTDNDKARRGALLALLAGLSVVGLALVIDILRYLDFHHYNARFLSLTSDRGLPELVMDGLVLLAAFLTARLYFRTGLRSFVLIAGLLTFIALDDFFSLHERFGWHLANWLDFTEVMGIEGKAWGELAFMVLLGLACIPLFLWSIWGLHPENLAILAIYGALFAVFVGFAAGVDLLHGLAQSSFMDRLIGWIEDGGEILVMTGVAMVAILQWRDR